MIVVVVTIGITGLGNIACRESLSMDLPNKVIASAKKYKFFFENHFLPTEDVLVNCLTKWGEQWK